jgi:hypothetical protein
LLLNEKENDMAKHDVSFSVPQRALGKADVEFRVKIDGSVAGVLRVSNGSIVWIPKGKGSGPKVSWKRFDEIMQKYGRRSEKR